MSITRDRTTEYALGVVGGEIVAGELVIAACARHLTDIRDGAARGLEWRPAEAERIIDAYPANFTITDGPAAGEPFALLDWMLFCTGSLFGWYRQTKEGDWRWRFDEAWIETAKGQGKSPWMACTGVLAMAAFGRKRAVIIVTGPKEEQAAVTMKDAGAAVQGTIPGEEDGVSLESQGKFVVRGIGDNVHKIEHVASKSVFDTRSGKATQVSGPRPFVVFVDECHELVSTGLIDMWQAALAKNAVGGFLICCTNTPATSQPVGTHYSERAQAVVMGRDANDALFVFITRVDVADRKTALDDEAVWKKPMPALGITYPYDNIRREVAKARLNPSEKARVERLYMGIPTGAVDFWLDDSAWWDRAQAPVDEKLLANLRCWLSLDLSDKHDLTALTATWELPLTGDEPQQVLPDGSLSQPLPGLVSKSWYWTVAENIEKRSREDRMPYELWVSQERLTAVPGATITKDFVAVQVAQLVAEQKVEFLVFDVAGIAAFREACDRVGLATWVYKGPKEKPGRGLKMVAHSQGTKRAFKGDQLDMHTSIEATEEALRLGQMTIDDSPVTYACAANAAPITDLTGNRAFDKQRSRGRIDGLITTVMGVGAARMAAVKPARSVYEERGALVL